jgi:hypothetical protein
MTKGVWVENPSVDGLKCRWVEKSSLLRMGRGVDGLKRLAPVLATHAKPRYG